MAVRKIIHVDMDAFYASVEQRDDPTLRGRPVVVGGPPHSRGVVCAASYEARAFGVRSALPSSRAARLCPEAVFITPNFGKYEAASRAIHAVFREVTDDVEPLALDEAFLDVTVNHLDEFSAGRLARHLKHRIFEDTALVASAGVGPNKLIAKLASGFEKPDGLVIVPPERVLSFLEPMEVGALWGVGPAMVTRLAAIGLRTVNDVRAADPSALGRALGRFGAFLYEQAFGRDERPVEARGQPRSVGSETTLKTDTRDLSLLSALVCEQANDVALSLTRAHRQARTLTLKVRFSDFESRTRSRTLSESTADTGVIAKVAQALLSGLLAEDTRDLRLVGVSATNLEDDNAPRQLSLDLPGVRS